MDRVRFIEHQGKRIILLDFSGMVDPVQGMEVIAEATRFIGTQPVGGGTLTLTDVTETRYTREIIEAFKEMTVKNRPIVKAAAVVSTSTLHRAAIGMVALFSRRRLHVCDTRAQALDWLTTQG